MAERGKFILVTGGARSGKSDFAEQLASETGKPVTYIATAEAGDAEMAARIEKHRQRRPSCWETVEESTHVAAALKRLDSAGHVFLIDCLTVLVSNWLLEKGQSAEDGGFILDSQHETEVLEQVEALAQAARATEADVILVTNEVGWGLVPAYTLGRIYRDLSGKSNQYVAALSDEVYLVVAGIPVQIK